ncbi:sugar 3,4-ketoisomerase [Bdellovibrio sp.]|uniref:sugar 3,4-ketoisomerase n=1 Tax=Bdellovibrio sp. TaxID=28201 RepID=UPI0039E5FAA8
MLAIDRGRVITPHFIEFRKFGDHRGSLVAIEGARSLPFEIRRIYYIYGNTDCVRRGFHAHKNLKQVAIAVSGSCKFLLDNGSDKAVVELNSPDRGLLIEGHIWREMYDFTPDCVLLVLADQVFDESDYIRNYSEFLSFVSNKD